MPDSPPTGDMARLRAAVESSPSGLMMVDAAGRIVLINREIERLFGYDRDELLGQSVETVIPERFRAGHPSERARYLAAPQKRSMGAGRELFGRRKGGGEVPVEIGLTPIESEGETIVLAAVVDVTARKQAEARFRAAVEASPAGLVMVDAAGHIVLVNREVERLFGYDRDELMGEPIERLVPTRFRGSHPAFRADFHRSPGRRAMGAGRDLYGLTKDGREVPVEIGLTPLETDEGLFVLSSIVDISDRKRLEDSQRALEERLRQAQKMEAVGTLAGGVAHDFNNILGVILGYVEILLERAGDEESRDDLAEVLSATTRGRDLVAQLMGFSRRQNVELTPVDLQPTLEEAMKLLRATLPATVDLELQITPGPHRVLGHTNAIQQALVNLATNSAQAMSDRGRLTISLSSLYVVDHVARSHPALREGHYELITVRDTGPGFDPALRNRYFEPFFTTKPPGEGTGLGLTMVHRLITDQHGAVVLDGGGADDGGEVKCYLPVYEGSPRPTTTPTPSRRGRGERLLFIDDEPALARLAARRLSALGFNVESVTAPAEAIALTRARPTGYDVVITDYAMPGMDGLALATAVAAICPGIPIILLSGYVDHLGPDALAEAGVTRVMRKPVTGDQLCGAIIEVVDARSSDGVDARA